MNGDTRATVIACLLCTSLAAQQPAGSPPQGTPGFTELYEDEVTIPMQTFGGRPVISARINGAGPYAFILDTGSGLGAIIDRKVLEEAGIELGQEIAVPGMPGRLALIESLLFEGAEMTDVHAVASDVSGFFGNASSAPQGILGIRLFRDCLLTMDFPREQYILREGSLPEPGGEVIAYQDVGVPEFPLDVGGVEIRVHMDTGSQGGLTLLGVHIDQIALVAPPVAAGSIRTPMGGATVRSATLDGTLRLAGKAFERPVVKFADLPQMMAGGVGNVGSEILSAFAITFDQKLHRLRFQGKQ